MGNRPSRTRTQPRTLPAQERSRDTVDVLLEAAERVGRRVGFDDATTKEIATIAGVSIGTLYRYFPSKEALLAALVRRYWDQGLAQFGEGIALMKPGPFEDTVEEIVRLTFAMISSRLEAFAKMRIETNNVVHLSGDLVDNAAQLLQGSLERRRDVLLVDDLRVASIIVVRSVVFLARVGMRDHPDLVESGRYPTEVAKMVSRYLVKAGS